MRRSSRISVNDLPKSMRDQLLSKPQKQPRGMNKTEAAYAEHLDAMKKAGLVQWWGYEAVRLVIADGQKKAWFKPDFLVVFTDGRVEFHETKGFWREAARLRIKVAAERYPWAKFWAVTAGSASTWVFENF